MSCIEKIQLLKSNMMQICQTLTCRMKTIFKKQRTIPRMILRRKCAYQISEWLAVKVIWTFLNMTSFASATKTLLLTWKWCTAITNNIKPNTGHINHKFLISTHQLKLTEETVGWNTAKLFSGPLEMLSHFGRPQRNNPGCHRVPRTGWT